MNGQMWFHLRSTHNPTVKPAAMFDVFEIGGLIFHYWGAMKQFEGLGPKTHFDGNFLGFQIGRMRLLCLIFLLAFLTRGKYSNRLDQLALDFPIKLSLIRCCQTPII